MLAPLSSSQIEITGAIISTEKLRERRRDALIWMFDNKWSSQLTAISPNALHNHMLFAGDEPMLEIRHFYVGITVRR